MRTIGIKAQAAALLLAGLAVLAGGCGDDPASPSVQPPTLPEAARLTVDLAFFDAAAPYAAATTRDPAGELRLVGSLLPQAKENFVAAYLRATVIRAWTGLALAPPVTAVAVALGQTPQRQPDGSWLWVYTHVYGDQEWQLRLRGAEQPEGVDWELRVTVPGGPAPVADGLWFAGSTWNEGAGGFWTFHDPTLTGDPEVATVAWGIDGLTETLTLTALSGEDAGDELAFDVTGPEREIRYRDDSAGQTWHIRWNEETGAGSLQVPDYNSGQPACWDGNQDDVACGAPS